MKCIHHKPLWALPNPSLWGFCNLWEILSGGLRESALCAPEHLTFVKQSLWHLLLLEVKPPRWLGVALELSSVWWVLRKFVKIHFAIERKEQELVKWGKRLKETRLGVGIVSNSTFLNRDVGITVVILNFGKQILVSTVWFAFLCSCYPNCLSD
jgi:hypothetical protein